MRVMLLREIRSEEQGAYNQVVTDPLQSWQWGEFRKTTGLQIERLGFFENGKLKKALQLSFHSVPIIGGAVGYLPKADPPDPDQLSALRQVGKKYNSIFIKLEPNLRQDQVAQLPAELIPGKPVLPKYTFQIDLTQAEETLFARLATKTRYNVNLAHKKGVKIYEDSSPKGLEVYLDILKETTTRQEFYAHSPGYFRAMWEKLQSSRMMRIFHAVYGNDVLVSWIVFIFNGMLYYPYGASRAIHREVMASNLMMWEMIKFGKQEKCHTFDLWGCLGPNPDPKNPWFGFHRFKSGYGGELVEFVGSYDYVLKPTQYRLFSLANSWRWKLLKLKAKLKL